MTASPERDRDEDRERAEDDHGRAGARRGPAHGELDAVADVTGERDRAVADRPRHVARSAGRRVDPEQEECERDRAGSARGREAQRRAGDR